MKHVAEYKNGRVRTGYYREENGVVYYYDPEKKAISIELINDLRPGATWEKYDKSWKYTIIDTVSSYSTPYCELKNLLQVRAEPQNETRKGMFSYYNLFYKRGVGMVGMKVNGEPFLFANPNKEPNERNFVALGCENIKLKEEQQQCTYQMIYSFISDELRASRIKNYKQGKIVLKVIIDSIGKVDNVEVVESIEGAQSQEKELIKIIKKLPKMIPAQVDDDQPIRSTFRVPINF